MSGEIGVVSQPDKGSLFWFDIPFEVSDPLEERARDKKPKARPQHASSQTKSTDAVKILIAEDHKLNQLFLEKRLCTWGIKNVTFVENGLAAIQAVKDNTYDLILMDCHMPDMNGYQATRSIRGLDDEDKSKTPIIAITADVISGTKEKCLEAGMDTYISKPIDTDILKSILANWINFSSDVTRSAENAPVDTSMLYSVTDSPDDLKAYIALFFKEIEQNIATLEANFQDQKGEAWSEAAHKMKNGAGLFGAQELLKLCEQAQRMDSSNIEGRPSLLDQIREEYEHVKAFLLKLDTDET